MSSIDNLREAFAGESQANRKYLAFALKAEDEGFKQVARLFRAAADAETVHAHSHLAVLEGVKSTAENLQEAVDGETHEFESMYPEMIKEAEAEGNQKALMSFKNAIAAEKVHAGMYNEALEAVKSGKDLDGADMYVCQICGHTTLNEAPDVCPVCGQPKTKFKKIE